MSIFKPINEKDAKGKVKKVFDDIKHTRNIKIFQIFGNLWPIVQKLWREPGII